MEQEVDRCNTEEILNVNRTSFRASQLYFSDQIRVSWNQLGRKSKLLKSRKEDDYDYDLEFSSFFPTNGYYIDIIFQFLIWFL